MTMAKSPTQMVAAAGVLRELTFLNSAEPGGSPSRAMLNNNRVAPAVISNATAKKVTSSSAL